MGPVLLGQKTPDEVGHVGVREEANLCLCVFVCVRSQLISFCWGGVG